MTTIKEAKKQILEYFINELRFDDDAIFGDYDNDMTFQLLDDARKELIEEFKQRIA